MKYLLFQHYRCENLKSHMFVPIHHNVAEYSSLNHLPTFRSRRIAQQLPLTPTTRCHTGFMNTFSRRT